VELEVEVQVEVGVEIAAEVEPLVVIVEVKLQINRYFTAFRPTPRSCFAPTRSRIGFNGGVW
jgi:hypothetical protein